MDEIFCVVFQKFSVKFRSKYPTNAFFKGATGICLNLHILIEGQATQPLANGGLLDDPECCFFFKHWISGEVFQCLLYENIN